jgi:hypothetical protein
VFVGRETLIADITGELDPAGCSLIVLTGPGGIGKTSILRAALTDRPHVYHVASPLPGDVHFEELARALERWPNPAVKDDGAVHTQGSVVRRRRLPPDTPAERWGALLETIELRAAGSDATVTLVIDDAEYIADAHRSFGPAMGQLFDRVKRRGSDLNVVLCGTASGAFERMVTDPAGLGPHVDRTIRVGPLTFRHASAFFPEYSVQDRIRAYAIFGGFPSILRQIHGRRSIARNVIDLVLSVGAPLKSWPLTRLHTSLQSIGRYVAVLAAVSQGATRWGEILHHASEFPSGGQMTPYIQRLEALGLLESRRSLDDEPGSRNRRYEVSDPFLRFWYRFVLPARERLELGEGLRVWEESVRPALEPFVAECFPLICRQFLWESSNEIFGLPAREVGSIWGVDPGREIPVTGTLAGGVVCYGTAHWDDREVGVDALEDLRSAMRRTRYGVARMARTQLIFSRNGFAPALRARAASDEGVRLIGLGSLVGDTTKL